MTQSNRTRTVKFLVTPNEFVRLMNLMETKGFVCFSAMCREMLLGRGLHESEMLREIHQAVVGGENDGRKEGAES